MIVRLVSFSFNRVLLQIRRRRFIKFLMKYTFILLRTVIVFFHHMGLLSIKISCKKARLRVYPPRQKVLLLKKFNVRITNYAVSRLAKSIWTSRKERSKTSWFSRWRFFRKRKLKNFSKRTSWILRRRGYIKPWILRGGKRRPKRLIRKKFRLSSAMRLFEKNYSLNFLVLISSRSWKVTLLGMRDFFRLHHSHWVKYFNGFYRAKFWKLKY